MAPFLLPREGLEIRRAVRRLPVRLADCVDHQRHDHEQHVAPDQDRHVGRGAANRDLRRRHKAQHEGDQRPHQAATAEDPHPRAAKGHLVRTWRVRLGEAQVDRRGEHQHIHDQVQRHRQLAQDLVSRLHRGHDHEHDRQERDDQALQDQDVGGHAVLVHLLEERRQVARTAHRGQAGRGARHPDRHPAQHTEGQCDRDERRRPRHPEGAKEIVIPHQQALRQIDLLGGDHHADGQRAKHEDHHRHDRGDCNRNRVVARGVVDILDVDRVHLHAGVKEEYASGQHQVVEVAEVRDHVVPGELDLHRLAAGHIKNAQNDQDARRDDGADHAAPLRERRCRLDAAQRGECRCPVDDQHEHNGVHVVRGERLIPRLVRTDEGERHGGECQRRGEPDGRFQPHQEDGHEPPARAKGLAYPAEHAALLRPGGCELGRHDRHRDQEEDRGKEVVED